MTVTPNPVRQYGERPGRQRVLLVDDDIRWLDSLALLLRDEGYAVEKTTDGRTCLERLKRGDIDLLILDLSIPPKSASCVGCLAVSEKRAGYREQATTSMDNAAVR
jgi:CheY-like chemotaxis protein